MSSIYVTEPPTTAKVTLNTTYGPLELELWARECPKTCLNFMQLCMDGIYNGTIFHRIVPEFCIQSGLLDFSAYKEPELTARLLKSGPPKEFHSRLRFNRRGILGAVSMDKKNSDPSQFFITLASAPELNNDCTCFGRVVGDTLFNAIRIGEIGVEDERPFHNVIIETTEIPLNPFEDMIPRSLESRQTEPIKSKLTIKNIHTISHKNHDLQVSIKSRKVFKQATMTSVATTVSNGTEKASQETDFISEQKQQKLDVLKAEIEKLERELVQPPLIPSTKSQPIEPSSTLTKSAIKSLREQYCKKPGVIVGKRHTDTEAHDTLMTLIAFRQKLHQQRQQKADTSPSPQIPNSAETPTKILEICKLHGLVNCLSCKDTFGLTERNDTEEGWMLHRLVFDRAELDTSIRKDLQQLVVIDPKEETKKHKKMR